MESSAHGEAEVIDPRPFRPGKRRLVLTTAVALIAISTLVVVGVVPRLRAATELKDDRARAANEPAKVTIAKAGRQLPGSKVELPGTMQAVQEAVVYARTSGYVRKYDVDIGDVVKAGQILATLDTPDIDQELRGAEASTHQAAANIEAARTQLELAGTESTRYQALAGQGVVSKQDMEEHKAGADARGANLKAMQAAQQTSQANLARLHELKSFATVVAPFDGVITQRTVEIGQLVTAGISQPMFRVANTSVMRVFVNVPQVYAAAVRVGDDATISLRELPNHPFHGQVARTSKSLDPATRTLLTEIRIPNPDGALISGMYASLSLPVSRVDGPVMIKPSSLVADATGTRVAIVDKGEIHWREVKVDADLGDQIAILSGLDEGAQVVLAPSERLTEGLKVAATELPLAKKP